MAVVEKDSIVVGNCFLVLRKNLYFLHFFQINGYIIHQIAPLLGIRFF